MKIKKELIITIVMITVLLLLSILINDVKNSNIMTIDGKTFKISYKDYYIKIVVDDIDYLFELDSSSKTRVTSIDYIIGDAYKCIFPTVKSNEQIEILCYDGKIYYNYHDILSKDKKLDEQVKLIKDYNASKYLDDKLKINNIENINIYTNNYIDKGVSITTYDGLINNNKKIQLFKKDVYNNELSTFVDSYYLIADYSSNYTFNYFYLVNLSNNDIEKIKLKDDISFDSYIQGVVGNNVYIYDINNEKQYEISIKNKSCKEISNDEKVKYYKNNKWTYINKAKANKTILFDYNDLSNDFTDYDEVIKTDKYFYLFKKANNKYDVYKVNIDNLNIVKYIFTTDTKDIKVKDNFAYYISEDNLYYYSENTGLKTILNYNELSFNDTIKFNIYEVIK